MTRPSAHWQTTSGRRPMPVDRSSSPAAAPASTRPWSAPPCWMTPCVPRAWPIRGWHRCRRFELMGRPPGDGLVIGVSHEGGTWATNEALRGAQRPGARTALITVSDRSPGAALAGRRGADRRAGPELVPHRRLPVADADRRRPGRDAARAGAGPGCGARAARQRGPRRQRPKSMAQALHRCRRLLVVGSGVDYATARELALKIEEGAHLPSSRAPARDDPPRPPGRGRRAHRPGPGPHRRRGPGRGGRGARGGGAALGGRPRHAGGGHRGADLGDDLPLDLTPAGRAATPLTTRLSANGGRGHRRGRADPAARRAPGAGARHQPGHHRPRGPASGRGGRGLTSARGQPDRVRPELLRGPPRRGRGGDRAGHQPDRRRDAARPLARRDPQPQRGHLRGCGRVSGPRRHRGRRARHPADRHGAAHRRPPAHRRRGRHPLRAAGEHPHRGVRGPGAPLRRADRQAVRAAGLPLRRGRAAAGAPPPGGRASRAVRGPEGGDRVEP